MQRGIHGHSRAELARATQQDEHTAGKDNYNRHADLLLLRHGTKIYVDVLVTRPTRASLLHTAAGSQQQRAPARLDS